MSAFRLGRDILVIVACLCVIVLTAEVFYVQARIVQVVRQVDTNPGGGVIDIPTDAPTDLPTGCPFGSLDCGG